jgi:hypothetical protein
VVLKVRDISHLSHGEIFLVTNDDDIVSYKDGSHSFIVLTWGVYQQGGTPPCLRVKGWVTFPTLVRQYFYCFLVFLDPLVFFLKKK